MRQPQRGAVWYRLIRIVAFVPRMWIRRRRVHRPVIRTHLSSRFIHCHEVAIRGSSYLLAPSTKTRHFAFAHHSSVNDVISWQQYDSRCSIDQESGRYLRERGDVHRFECSSKRFGWRLTV